MNKTIKAVVFWFVIVVAATLLWQVIKAGNDQQKIPEISYSQFLSEVEAGNVAKVTVSSREVSGFRSDRSSFRVIAPSSQGEMIDALRQAHVEIWFRDTVSGDWPTWLMNLAPLLLLGALWFFMIRQLRASTRAHAQNNSSTAAAAGVGTSVNPIQ